MTLSVYGKMTLRAAVLILLVAGGAAAQEPITVLVPAVGNLPGPGGIQWKSDVEIANPGSFPADVALELTTLPDAPAILLTLAPGQVERFSDLVGQVFGINGALSPLRVISASGSPIIVRSTAYAIKDDARSPLQPVNIYGSDTWFPVRVLDGLDFTDEARTNIGLLNLGDSDAEFVLALQRLTGRNVAVSHVTVRAGALLHAPIQGLFPLITKGDNFSVIVETFGQGTHVYASVVDNSTNGATFVMPRVGAR